MLNLLQTNICGSNSASNSAKNRNDNHFLNKNLQQNGHLRSEQFEENMKIEHITSGNQIAFIKIRDNLTSATSVKNENKKRTKFQQFFAENYPDFFHHYCPCMQRKIEPDDLNTVSTLADDKYGANSFLLNRTPIIPITVDPKKYIYDFIVFFDFPSNYYR